MRFPVTTYIAGTAAVEITRKYRGLTWHYAEKGLPSFLPSVSLLALDLSSLAPLPRYMENLLYLPAIFIPRHPCPVVGPRLSTPLNYTYTGSRKRRNVIKRDFAPFRGDIRVSIRGNGFFRGIL